MKFLSVCSGIEAASVAWNPLGWRCAGLSEIEPFPCSVLTHHYPETPNHGDLTQWERWIYDVPAFDVLAGGTPCQGFSVAGRRGGMDDPRSQLAFDFLGIAHHRRPRWVVWENVPGVLSSAGGRDFGAFLGALGQCGYGFAYRVLDAQWFGVAQRRKRLWVVGCLGNWRGAAAVLFEPPRLSRRPAPRREQGQGFAHDVAASLRGSGCGTERVGHIDGGDPLAAAFNPQSGGDCRGLEPREAAQLQAGQVPAVAMCLNAGGQNRIDAESETLIPAMCFDPNQITSAANRSQPEPDVAHTLPARVEPPVLFTPRVRRLTPRECERLQGFPDDYTLVQHRGKPAADGPRYRALGNSWAVPNARWIGERIAAVDAAMEAR